MPSYENKKLKDCIISTARRLCIIRSELADEEEHVQSEYLSEEIERVLRNLNPEDRKIFLEELKTRFPLPEDLTFNSMEPADVAHNDTTVKEPEIDDPDLLADRLLQAIALIDEDRRKQILNRFQRPEKSEPSQLNVTASGRLSSLLSIDESEAAHDNSAMGSLLESLVEFVIKIEPIVWKTWSQISSRNVNHASGNLPDKMRCLIASEPDITIKDIESELKKLQRLIVAMISAPKRASEEFAAKYVATYSPREIRSVVRLEGKSFMKAESVRCWEKYEKLSELLSRDAIEKEIKKAIVDYINTFMNVGRRS